MPSTNQSVDADELRSIQRFRAAHDPIIAHEPSKGWFGSVGPDREDIVTARLAMVEAASSGERIRNASWAEAVAYCATASMDAAAALNERFVGTYQYAFERFLAVHYEMEAEQLSPSLRDGGLAGVTPGDYADTAEDLRHDIKRDLDRHFIDEGYDALPFDPTIPKAFWADALVDETGTDTNTDLDGRQHSGSSQLGLDMF